MFNFIIVFQILFQNGYTNSLFHYWEFWMFCIFCFSILLTVLEVCPIVALIFIFWWLMKLNSFSCYCPFDYPLSLDDFSGFLPIFNLHLLVWFVGIPYTLWIWVIYQMCITNTFTHSMGCPFTDWYTLRN